MIGSQIVTPAVLGAGGVRGGGGYFLRPSRGLIGSAGPFSTFGGGMGEEEELVAPRVVRQAGNVRLSYYGVPPWHRYGLLLWLLKSRRTRLQPDRLSGLLGAALLGYVWHDRGRQYRQFRLSPGPSCLP